MGKKFLDSKLYKLLEFAGNMIALNLVYVITCIPVLTIGASTTALYASLNADMSTRTFLSAYKKNWKQSTVVWLILIVLIDLAFFNGVIVVKNKENPSVIQIVALIFSVLMAGLFFSWVFDLIAMFENKTGDILKNSVLLGLANLPTTLVIIVLNLIFPAALVFSTDKFVQYGWIWLGFGFSVISYVCSVLIKRAITRSTGVIFKTEEIPSEED